MKLSDVEQRLYDLLEGSSCGVPLHVFTYLDGKLNQCLPTHKWE